MATFFGEVVQKESRAFWDDLEECVEGFGVEVEILDQTCLDSSYKILIVTDGILATQYAQKRMLKSSTKKVALFYETLTTQCKKKSPSVLYRLNNTSLLFTTNDTLDIKLANTLVLKLIPWLQKCSEVVVFTSLDVSIYKNTNHIDVYFPFVRCLATSSFKGSRFAPQLELPNYLSGFSASVLSLWQVLKRSAISYICYSDSDKLDAITAVPLSHLINHLQIKHLLLPDEANVPKKPFFSDFLTSNLFT